MKKQIACLAALLLCLCQLQAQFRCGFEQGQATLRRLDPSYDKNIERMNTELRQYMANQKTLQINGRTTGLQSATVYIPCVVHVIHTGGAIGTSYNPTDAQISSAINYLNSVYDGTWTGSGGSILGVGDLQIKFVLATKDPSNAATTGIERMNGSSLTNYTANGVNASGSTGAGEISVKNLTRWDPYKYYNIWLVNKIDGCDGISGCPSFIAGYAYFPVSSFSTASSLSLDGTIMLASQMIPGQKTLPHEIGHAFNLYHPFQGETDQAGVNGCPVSDPVQGDQCADTDPVTNPFDDGEASSFACRTGSNHCYAAVYSDNTEKNFMNYTNCYRLFTNDQKTRMQAAAVATMRASLATSWANNQGTYPVSWAPPVAASVIPVSAGAMANVAGILSVSLNGHTIYSMNATQDGGYMAGAAKWYNLFDLQTTTTYTMTVRLYGSNSEQLGVYLDYDGDGSFNNTSEKLFYQNSIAAAGGGSVVTFSFTTPAVTATSTLRLRITEDLSTVYGTGIITNTTTSLTYGQAEDYPVFIKQGSTLPADLTFFDGYKVDGGIRLNWGNAGEKELKEYLLQRSVNGQDFDPVTTVPARGAFTYSFDDRQVYAGTYYYRLKMKDNNGAEHYSRIISFSYLSTGGLIVLTNPFSDHIDFLLPRGNKSFTCRLIDEAGRVVLSRTGVPAGGGVSLAVTKNVVNGLYILEVVQDGKTYTSRLVK